MFSTNWPLMMEWTPALLLPIASFLALLSLLLLLSSLKGNICILIKFIQCIHHISISALFHLQIPFLQSPFTCQNFKPAGQTGAPLPLLFAKRNTNATRKLRLYFFRDGRGSKFQELYKWWDSNSIMC